MLLEIGAEGWVAIITAVGANVGVIVKLLSDRRDARRSMLDMASMFSRGADMLEMEKARAILVEQARTRSQAKELDRTMKFVISKSGSISASGRGE